MLTVHRTVSRKFVDKLQQRIETLEALNSERNEHVSWAPRPIVEDHSIALDDTFLMSRASTRYILPILRSRWSEVTMSRISSDFNSPLRLTDADGLLSTAVPPTIDSNELPPTATNLSTNAQELEASYNSEASPPPDKSHHSSPSFYGATSHPHVSSPGDEPRLPAVEKNEEVGIELEPHSPRVRDNILRRFFKYQTVWIEVVNQAVFQEGQKLGQNSRWYSTFLENAMLAYGTRVSTSRSIRALGSKFFELATKEVWTALSDPTPANLQAFLLLSEYEITRGNDRSGWMLCGTFLLSSMYWVTLIPTNRPLSFPRTFMQSLSADQSYTRHCLSNAHGPWVARARELSCRRSTLAGAIEGTRPRLCLDFCVPGV